MKNRTPTPRDQRAPLPAFDPVPRHTRRHDGWTPERQVAFIEALADTGSVSHAATQVNMSSESAYALRRHPQGGGFARAWSAALDMGLLRLKDEAFERAMNGQLVPIVAGGKLVGYRRKKNDRLLMFCLRHYAHDDAGRRSTVDHFARSPAQSPTQPPAQPPARPMRTATRALPSPDLTGFAGVALDEEAQAQIAAILEACAARIRRAEPADDPAEPFLAPTELTPSHPDALRPPLLMTQSSPAAEGDEDWRTLDLPDQRDAIAAAVAAIEAKKASGEWDCESAEDQAKAAAKRASDAKFATFIASGRPVTDWTGE